MKSQHLFLAISLIISFHLSSAQSDSTFQQLQDLQDIPVKFINTVDNKIDLYSNRITSKTEKTLAKLSRWENKIEVLLRKVNPEAAEKLFGNVQTTFSSLLQKIKQGKMVVENYKAKYDDYRDKLTSSLKYLEVQKDQLNKKLVEPLAKANRKVKELEDDVRNTEAVEQFIKQRKKQCMKSKQFELFARDSLLITS